MENCDDDDDDDDGADGDGDGDGGDGDDGGRSCLSSSLACFFVFVFGCLFLIVSWCSCFFPVGRLFMVFDVFSFSCFPLFSIALLVVV